MKDRAIHKIEDHRYRVLIDNAPEAVFILDIETGKFIDFNQNALDFFSLSSEELCTKGPLDLSPHEINGQPAQVLASSALEEAMRGGNPVFDWIHYDKDQNEVPCEIRLVRFPPYDKKLIRASLIDKSKQKKIEAALEESQESLKLALRATGSGYTDFYLEDGRLYWDERAHELFGLPVDAEVDRYAYFFSILHPEDQERVIQNSLHLTSPEFTGNTFEDEYRIIRQGEVVHLVTHGLLVRNAKGEVYRIIGTNRDVTDHKKTKMALENSEERLKLALHATGVGSSDWSLDERKLHWDDRIHELFGLPTNSKLDRREYFLSIIHPEDLERVRQNYSLITSPEYKEDTFVDEYRIIKQGEIFHIQTVTLLIRNDKGELQRMIGSSQDITERRRIEQALRISEERFKVSTKAAKVGIWDLDITKDSLIWDDTMYRLYGLKSMGKPMVYETWKKAIHPDDLEKADREIQLALEEKNEFNLEFRVTWPDKSVHYIKSMGTVQRDPDGTPIRLIGTNWDITKEKEAERQKIRTRQLELKNKELEQFAYVASHDLQEPLRTVTGFVGLLKLRYQDKLDQEANEHLEYISQAGARMNKLIKALLDYSRIGRDKKITTVDVNHVIKNIIKDLTRQVSESNASFEIGPMPKIKGYETELHVLFQNLTSNAIKFRKKEVAPKIQISSKKIQDFWEFCISDNSIGIDPQFKEKIFVIFQRLQSRSDYEGTGIGLAHCQKIVDLHGGKIWVESTLGEGSSFYFTIPE